MRIEGNDNYTIDGNENHMGDNVYNGDVHHHYTKEEEEAKNNSQKEEIIEEKELEEFFEIGLQKTPLFNSIFLYMSIIILLGLEFIRYKLGFSIEIFLIALVTILLGLYWLYNSLQVKLFDMVYIKENEVTRGQSSYAYNLIRINDIVVNRGKIKFGFIDDSTHVLFDLKDDAAGLLKYKIEEYHQFYNLRN